MSILVCKTPPTGPWRNPGDFILIPLAIVTAIQVGSSLYILLIYNSSDMTKSSSFLDPSQRYLPMSLV